MPCYHYSQLRLCLCEKSMGQLNIIDAFSQSKECVYTTVLLLLPRQQPTKQAVM